MSQELTEDRILKRFFIMDRKLPLAVALAIAAAACNDEAHSNSLESSQAALSPQQAQTLNASNAPGDRLGVYRAFWPKRDDSELFSRVSKVAGLIRKTPLSLLTPKALRSAHSTPFDDPSITVSYNEKFDDLTVKDTSLLPDIQPQNDIGESAARAKATEVFKLLYSVGLATEGQHNLAELRTGHHRRVEYAGDGGPTKAYVVEYSFRALRRLNGIEVANNGIVVGISPTGSFSSLRIGGVEIESAVATNGEVPSSKGRVFARSVSEAETARRFASEVAPSNQAHVLSRSVMYVMPRSVGEAQLEPVLMYRYARKTGGGDGTLPVIEHTRTIGYSLEDGQKPARDLDKE